MSPQIFDFIFIEGGPIWDVKPLTDISLYGPLDTTFMPKSRDIVLQFRSRYISHWLSRFDQ